MLSQRRACRLVGIHRSVARHQSQRGNDSELRERLKQLAGEYPRYGYDLLHGWERIGSRTNKEFPC